MWANERLQRAPALAMGFGLGAFALAVRFWIDPVLPAGFPFLTFFPAVVLTTFFAGLRPGLACAVLGGAAAWYFFIPPTRSFLLDGATAVALGFYVCIVTVDVALIEGMRRAVARLRAERSRGDEMTRRSELLFNELQHRVANNLQVVSALLKLAQNRVGDAEAKRALSDSAARLELIGKIQRRLHGAREGDGATTVAAFAEELGRDAIHASGMTHVRLTVDADPEPLSPDQAGPLFLIMLECVNNALEHAFVGRDTGAIAVTWRRVGPDRVLTIADDGRGPPAGFDPRGSADLGLRIAQALAGQLGGRFTLVAGPAGGAECRLVFPAEAVS